MYLTVKHKAAIERSIWQMRLSEIENALAALPKRSPRSRKRLLLTALKAACEIQLSQAMAPIGAAYLAEFRIIPPAFYAMTSGDPSIYFSGQRLIRSHKASQISLALVHPQIYR